MTSINHAAWQRPLLAAGIAMTAVTAVAPSVAQATPLPSALAMAAASQATYEDKLKVAVKFGLGDDSALLERADRDFVISIWNHVKNNPDAIEVRIAAEAAFTAPDAEADQASYQFIVADVFTAFDRDVQREKQEADAKRQSDLARTAAAASIDVVADAALLNETDEDFIRLIWERVADDAKWPKVKAAARAALDGTAEQQRQFIAAGMAEAAKRDIDDRIAADEAKTEAEKQAELARAAKKFAANRIGLAVTTERLNMPDRDFVVEVWNNTPDGSEVQAAAVAAARSLNPADWKAFIDTGIHQAKDRDIQIALDKLYQADRALATQLKAVATKNGDLNLVQATTKALAGTPTQLSDFLRIGQFDLELRTGFEANDVPLNGPHILAWKDAILNVNGCAHADFVAANADVRKANAEKASATAAIAAARVAVAAARTAAEKAAAAARLAAAQARLEAAEARKHAADLAVAACARRPAEHSVVAEKAHTGSKAIRYFGVDHDTAKSYSYHHAMTVSRVVVKPATTLSYWIYPEANTTVSHVVARNSTCVAIDLTFNDGSFLRNSSATDQRGNRAHPASQCGTLTVGQWNQVVVKLGPQFAGKTVTAVNVGYDQPAGTGGYRGYIDDVAITNGAP